MHTVQSNNAPYTSALGKMTGKEIKLKFIAGKQVIKSAKEGGNELKGTLRGGGGYKKLV